ncbi:MAG: hypothetical protein K6G81_09235 [Lachnospiraceae bacterium]|nr:hypothetical protein [Lachnospiraceae bacterium]
MRRKSMNDKGSALIVVIISMLLIGIIAAIVLKLAVGNLEKTGIGSGSSDNFYSAEQAVDEIKNQLSLIANEAGKLAYEKYLQTYSVSSKRGDDMDKKYAELFAEEFTQKLKTDIRQIQVGSESGLGTKNFDDLLYKNKPLVKVNEDGSTPRAIIETGSDGVKYVVIKGLSVSFRDGTGYVSKITTDLKFSVKSLKISLGADIGVSTSVADFVLITDRKISNGDAGAGASPTIMGNVYAGAKEEVSSGSGGATVVIWDGTGIEFDGGKPELYSDLVITRGTLLTKNGAELNISHSNEKRQVGVLRDYYGDVWADNILMDGSTGSTINIQGHCYVGDDLTINSQGSKFTLKGDESSYYGYNTNNKDEEADTSSAIIVNGENVKLDLERASMLWLAGKSYVNVPEQWGNPSGGSATFQQGESITYRSLQSAYLLPGECVVGLEHNPMTQSEFTEYAGSIDITKSYAKDRIDLTRFLDTTDPWKSETVNYGGEKLVYIYMNFKTPDKAAEYFQEYRTVYGRTIADKLKMAGIDGRIMIKRADAVDDSEYPTGLLDKRWVVNTGNIVYYDGTDYILYYKNTDYYDVKNKQIELSDKFNKYCTTLNPAHSPIPMTDDITGNIAPGIDEDIGTAARRILVAGTQTKFSIGDVRGYGSSADSRNAWMITSEDDLIINGTEIYAWVDNESGTGKEWKLIDTALNIDDQTRVAVELQSDVDAARAEGIRAGIILAKGNVTIKNGSDFWGTIIAKGNITLEGSASVYAASSDVKALMETNSLVISYFTEDRESKTGSTGGNGTDLVNIQYMNWTKE